MAKKWTVLCAALTVISAGCTASGTRMERGGSPTRQQTATVTRGSISHTVVIPATVEAGPHVEVTAPAAGVFTVVSGRIEYQLNAGGSGTLDLPSGLELLKSLIAPGSRVPQNYPLAEARVRGFALVATLDRSTTYKLYSPPIAARGAVDQGPGPFPCPLANRVPLDRGSASSGGDTVSLTLTCIVPEHLRVFSGMPAVMAVNTGTVNNVLILPVEAVAGSIQHGAVWVLDGQHRRHLRNVQLGITDGAQIEIRSGLQLGDEVLVPGPDLLRGNA